MWKSRKSELARADATLKAEHERHAQVLKQLLAEIEDEIAKQNAFFEARDQPGDDNLQMQARS